MKHNILLIDDEAVVRDSTKEFLEREGFFVKAVATGDEGCAYIRQKFIPFSLALVDYHLAEEKGPRIIEKIRALDPQLHLLGFSSDDSLKTHNESLDAGALVFVRKDVQNERLLSIVHRLCRDFEKRTKTLNFQDTSGNQRLIASVDMIGVSDHLAEIANQILKYAPSKSPILIRGENGTGKEKVARAIHENSRASRGPFIAVNCGAIPRDLIESELFGHEKGAFTGAMTSKIGKFQAANGGTIFLDEIGEMPLHSQVALLRVLQEREFTPVGSNTTKKIDVRVVAATNAPLETLIEAGRFREDLYYRLNALPILLKPLRERPEDIAPLVSFFLKAANEANGEHKEILDSCVGRLRTLRWPGNVRELGHAVQRMHIMEDGVTITENTFERAIRCQEAPANSEANDSTSLDYEVWRIKTNEEERSLIRKSLRMALNLKDAATKLAISRSHLRSRMRALEIENPFSEREET